MDASFVYMTCGDLKEARRIARTLVDERLAACANIIDNMRSVYWWQGAVQEDSEVVLISKTRRELVERLTGRVRELHSYAVPCVVELPIARGNPDYLRWLVDETAETITGVHRNT